MAVQQAHQSAGNTQTGGAQAPQQQQNNGGGWVLPESGAALPLVDADFQQAARSLGVEVAAIYAVATVEAGGRRGFDAQKRPKILFEPGLFHDQTHGIYDRTHPHISLPHRTKAERAVVRRTYRRPQWQQLHEAFALNPEGAVKSVSWGMFQVLGSNARMVGWPNVREFVDAMFQSEGQHLRAFVGFVRANHLVRSLQTHNWAAFARVYNGSAYREYHYDTKMAQAYAHYAAHHR